MRLLDLFSGRWGWSKAFVARGWECVGVDLVEPPETPDGCTWVRADILDMDVSLDGRFWYGNYDVIKPDFVVASSPCEQFSVHGMKHFHPNPKYPAMGMKLFNHTRELCEAAGVPYVMENVRAAQQFVGNAVHHCGPFYLWGSGVPAIVPQGIIKGMTRKAHGLREYKNEPGWNKRLRAAKAATIPPELANCVADYAERLFEQRSKQQG